MKFSNLVQAVITSTASVILFSSPAHAEIELAIYGGIQASPHGNAKGTEPNGTAFSFSTAWEGKSFDMPPYYGLRFTNWLSDTRGYSVNFAHAKAYADSATRSSSGFSTLEFTDGLNPITLNATFRNQSSPEFQLYGGVGVGFAVPHVELKSPSMTTATMEFQYGGPVVGFYGGFKRQISGPWSWFGEYAFHYVRLDVDMGSGGNFKTNIVTNAINVGISYSY